MMAEVDYSIVMYEAEISALKDTLCEQQQLLQKLYGELDAEREASSTAASEALSVILRLQGEKAAVQMEAEQYRRLAEEKICHAEESIAIFEDVVYQKEMQVAALDYQVQSYRYKLLNEGCIDSCVGEIKYPENLFQRNETLAGDTSLQSLGRRNSAPIPLKFLYQMKSNMEREGSTGPETDMVSKIVEEHTGLEINDQVLDTEKKTDNSTIGDKNSYWEHIRKLDERVEEITGGNYMNFRSESRPPSPRSSQLSSGNHYYPANNANYRNKTRSPSPQLSTGNPYDLKKIAIVNKIDETTSPGTRDILDVFEVPQVDQNCKPRELHARDEKKIACQGNESLKKASSVHPEAIKFCDKDEPEWLKELLQSIHHEKNLRESSDISAVDCCLAVDLPTPTVSKLNQLNSTSEIIERNSSTSELVEQNSTSEIIDAARPATGHKSPNRTEELKLLSEVKEQLNSIHCEIRSWKRKKLSREMELSLVPLMEEMLHFWL